MQMSGLVHCLTQKYPRSVYLNLSYWLSVRLINVSSSFKKAIFVNVSM